MPRKSVQLSCEINNSHVKFIMLCMDPPLKTMKSKNIKEEMLRKKEQITLRELIP